MEIQNQIVDIHGLSKALACSPITIQKTWREFPKMRLGKGNTAKSFRFDISDVLNYLKQRDYPNGISRQKNKKVGRGFQSNRIPKKKKKRIQNKTRGQEMGNGSQGKDSQSGTGADPIENFLDHVFDSNNGKTAN